LDERLYWHAFNQVPHIGAARIQQLVTTFGSLSIAWQASESTLRRSGLSANALSALLTNRSRLDLAAEEAKLQRLGVRLMIHTDADYPQDLARVNDAPAVLYVRGCLLPEDNLALAIVGTRRATRYGRDAAQTIARQLASRGVTIVSGLALGIDTAAHEGALEAGGRTIAVLGSGIDVTYPRENSSLAERITDNGALITEFPPGTPPTGPNFPRRNRILSGLSLGVLVAEAPIQSGALITAETALDQGREVFAIPANIFNKMGQGCNRLIQEGATLVMHAGDILDALNIAYVRVTTRHTTEQAAPDSDFERQILTLLENDPIHIDDLIRKSGLAAEQVSAALVLLELKGLAQTNGPMEYSRTR